MAKTVNNMISNNNEVELAKMKDSHVRRVVGVVGFAFSVGLIASSYV